VAAFFFMSEFDCSKAVLCLFLAIGSPSVVFAESVATAAKNNAQVFYPSEDNLYAADIVRGVTQLGQNQQAEKALSDALTTSPQNATIKSQLSQLKAADAAITAQRDEGAAKFPSSLPVQNAAAAAAIQAGDWEKGKVYADRAVTLAAKAGPAALEPALRTRALGEMWAGDFPAAASDAAKALKLRPNDLNARSIYEMSRGRSKGEAPQADAPERSLSSVLDDPRLQEAGRRAVNRQQALRLLRETRRLMEMNDPRRSLAAARSAQEADPALADGPMQEALALRALKNLPEALEAVTRAVRLWREQGNKDNLAAAYAVCAALENDLSRAALALADANEALALEPQSAYALFQRARAKQALGIKGEQLLADFRRAAEIQPETYRGYYEAALKPEPLKAPAAPPTSPVNIPLVAGAATAAILAAIVISRRGAPVAAATVAFGNGPEPVEDDSPRALNEQYDLREKIGEGGMGAVFKGWDKALKRPIAIKRLRPELQANVRERARFIKEAELVASLRHPHIVEIYTILHDEKNTHLVFEYLVGDTLHDLLNASPGRHISRELALKILGQIASAVDHAHARRVIHRDLKPANIMITEGQWVKVMDFGIARQVQDSLLTTTNTVAGTPTYMPPEQALGAVVKESDVFSLGVSLYEMLTGALPFKGPQEMNDKLSGTFVAPTSLVSTLPFAIDLVIKRALSPRPEDRYHTCAQLHEAAAVALSAS
jgi:tRNA A-37 threonylcarbamoyl transferase component Bud32